MLKLLRHLHLTFAVLPHRSFYFKEVFTKGHECHFLNRNSHCLQKKWNSNIAWHNHCSHIPANYISSSSSSSRSFWHKCTRQHLRRCYWLNYLLLLSSNVSGWRSLRPRGSAVIMEGLIFMLVETDLGRQITPQGILRAHKGWFLKTVTLTFCHPTENLYFLIIQWCSLWNQEHYYQVLENVEIHSAYLSASFKLLLPNSLMKMFYLACIVPLTGPQPHWMYQGKKGMSVVE